MWCSPPFTFLEQTSVRTTVPHHLVEASPSTWFQVFGVACNTSRVFFAYFFIFVFGVVSSNIDMVKILVLN